MASSPMITGFFPMANYLHAAATAAGCRRTGRHRNQDFRLALQGGGLTVVMEIRQG